jgi:RimJ/RimL family protein N-acetyltransferase
MISNNSKNIIIRAIETSDLPCIQKWRNLKSIQPYVREYRELSYRNIETWYNSIILDNKFEFFIIEDANRLPIGITGLTYIDWINKNADLHLAIYHEEQWIDKKYSLEVLNVMLDYGFNYLNLEKIYTEIYENDKKKLNFFTSNNFSQDAILRNHYYYKGTYINSYILSLLKSEYNV